jgi:hypothetical protein
MRHWYGWVLAVVAVVLVAADFVRIDSASHSVSDTLINWLPQSAVIVFIALALARLVDRRVSANKP